MHQVPGYDRLLALGADRYGDVTGRVARRWEKRDLFCQSMIGFHEVVQAGFDDGQYRVTDRHIQILIERLR